MVDQRTSMRIRSALLSGRAVLVTGAGFSKGAMDINGDELPLGRELAEQIWPIAFGTDPFEDSSSLGEVFRLANRKAGGLLKQHLDLVFTVDRNKLPDRYTEWLQLPWHRIYTLNIDDLDVAISETRPTFRPLKIFSAATSTPGQVNQGQLAVVHLNGRLPDFPELTFDPPAYGERTSRQDAWYQEFVSDIVTRPTVFVGTVLEEPPFWHYLTQRGVKGSVSETRPKSWLVSKRLPAARKALLAEYNIDLVEAYESDFYDDIIAPHLPELNAAAKGLAEVSISESEDYILDVAGEVSNASGGDADFLLGREPIWGDVTRGYAAEFDWDRELIENLRNASEGSWIVHGDPGSGKTTSLMRIAAVLAADGNRVCWVTRNTAKPPIQMANDVAKKNPDYVFIDNIERFSDSAVAIINHLTRLLDSSVIVAGIRTRRMHGLSLSTALPSAAYVRTPDLSDPDAIALVKQLDAGNRLGALQTMNAVDRVKAITHRAGRQLLVALIEATSGREFHNKIADECSSLDGLELAAYGVVCCAQAADNQYLTRDDILLAINEANNPGIAAISRLVSGRTIVDVNGQLRARHYVIAESSVKYFRDEGSLRLWMEHLIFLFALRYDPNHMTRGRYGRLLIRFLNHDFLRENLGDSSSVQTLYGSLENVLKHEFHYWLQRGSFEINVGDLAKAETFLRQAEAMQDDDFKFETAWGYLRLKQALCDPHQGWFSSTRRGGNRSP
ncbi:P-loop NTPase [Nocardia fluminea]|uniref:SIR2-like protein n=1 Tax=Nocardia fluminea TaxID=134984 RepID=A0A2N3VHS9_9NOCA|nr:SIR2 family protein [Nocardia fluminea]PKV81182.1 SIR2-like protein [Nocardia fluminea]